MKNKETFSARLNRRQNALDARLRRALPDRLDQILYNLLWSLLLFISVKLFVVLPFNNENHFFLIFKLLSIVNCFIIGSLMFYYPRYLYLLAKAGVILMSVFIVSRVLILPDQLNFVSIQHIYIVIMAAFYTIDRYWGMGSSIFFAIFVAVYILIYRDALVDMALLPATLPVGTGVILIIINFFQIGFMHYYYNRTLIRSVREVGDLNFQLKDLLHAKSNFLSVMSHELRTPLNSVVGTAHLLDDNEMDETQRQNIESIRASAESLMILINDILDFSKMDTDRTQLESVPFSIGEVMERVLRTLKQRAEDKTLRLSLEIDDVFREMKVIGDSARLTQIVYNLLGNAIKFTKDGEVSVGVHVLTYSKSDKSPRYSGGDHVKILFRVSDTGLGIDPQYHDHIFEPFTQVASSSTNRQFGGVGLGLAIVRHLVTLHGGQISVSSSLNKGAVFRLELTYEISDDNIAEDKPDRSGDDSSKAASSKDMSRVKLLLAEDNPMNILFMRQLLQRWGISPDIASDGEEVINLYNQGNRYDIILMDIHMPKMSGLEASAHIRRKEEALGGNDRTYIIALTASVSDRYTTDLDRMGIDDYVRKPFRPEELRMKLDKVLEIGS